MRIHLTRTQAIISAAISLCIVITGFLTWWALYYNNPDRILANSLSRLSQAQSAGFNGTLTAGDLTFAFKGDATRTATTFEAEISTGALALKGQVKADQQATYVQLSNAKEIAQKATANPLLAPYSAQLTNSANSLQGKWLKVSDETKAIDNSCANLLSANILTTPQQQQLSTLLRQHQFISVAEKLGTQDIAGQPHLHYKLQFNQVNAERFVAELLKIEPFKSSQKCLSTGSDKTDQKLFDSLEQTNIEIWIHERTHALSKINATMSEKNLTLHFTLNLELNKQVQITMPTTNIVSLKDLLETIKNGR